MPTIDLCGKNIISIQPESGYRNTIEFGGVHYPGVYRPGPVKVTMINRGSHVRTLMDAWQKCSEVVLKMQGFSVRAFVTELHPRTSIDGLGEVEVVFKPTGRPLRYATHYGKSFTESIIEKIAEATKIEANELMKDALGRVPLYTGALHSNCRCVPSITVKEKLMKVRNKFYVAAPSVTTNSEQAQDNTAKNVHLAKSPGDRSGKWTRKDLKDAIAHAEYILENDPAKDHVAIVRIVRVVRRKKAPVVVEVVS